MHVRGSLNFDLAVMALTWRFIYIQLHDPGGVEDWGGGGVASVGGQGGGSGSDVTWTVHHHQICNAILLEVPRLPMR